MKWQVKENKTIDEKVYITDLSPGPALYVLPREGFNKKYAIFSTQFGSIDNCFVVKENGGEKITVPDGVAHFLEHKLFDNEEGNVFDKFAAYGASPNAFTTFTHTTYLFSCTEFFPENLGLLLEFVQSPYFTEESVAKEQGIIQQEIMMYQDNPDWKVFFNLLSALYCDHPVRKDIAGDVDSINQITKDTLYTCYNTFYHPSNMAIFVTGDLVPDDVLKQVVEDLERRSINGTHEIERCYPSENAAVNEQKIAQELSVSQPVLNLGFKDTYTFLKGRDLLFRDLVTELLLEMIFSRSEPLYTRLYEEGLIDERFSAGFVAECSYGYTILGGKTKDPDRLHQRILAGIEGIKKEGLKEESFERHRRKMQGEFLKSFNSLEFIANNFLAYRFRGIDFFQIVDVLESIAFEDIESRLHDHLAEELHAVSIINPVRS